MRTLGVIGGMGPQASARFLQLLVDESSSRGATKGDDYPHILLSNLPVPEFFAGRNPEAEERAISMVEHEARALRDAGADILMIPCNTMHMYMPRFRERVQDVEWLSMIDEVTKTVQEYRLQIIGLLGSQSTVQSGLYRTPLEEAGVTVMTPPVEEQEEVVRLIAHCITGSVADEDTRKLMTIAQRLRQGGADGILLGCTELPLVARIKQNQREMISSLHVLASAACREAFA